MQGFLLHHSGAELVASSYPTPPPHSGFWLLYVYSRCHCHKIWHQIDSMCCELNFKFESEDRVWDPDSSV